MTKKSVIKTAEDIVATHVKEDAGGTGLLTCDDPKGLRDDIATALYAERGERAKARYLTPKQFVFYVACRRAFDQNRGSPEDMNECLANANAYAAFHVMNKDDQTHGRLSPESKT